jgi:polar amino acid transport system substrate-binding protein
MNGVPESDKPGYMIEIAKAIFEPSGIKVDYKLMPWQRALQQTRVGVFDCVVGAYKADAPDFLFPNNHWGVDETMFYKLKKDSWKYNGDTTVLNHRSIGIISGYSYGPTLDVYFTTHKVQVVSGDNALNTNIKKLMSGRIDTLVESTYVMAAKLQELDLTKKVVKAGHALKGNPMYFACGPSKKKWIKMVNDAMPILKRNGQLQKILKPYNINVW